MPSSWGLVRESNRFWVQPSPPRRLQGRGKGRERGPVHLLLSTSFTRGTTSLLLSSVAEARLRGWTPLLPCQALSDSASLVSLRNGEKVCHSHAVFRMLRSLRLQRTHYATFPCFSRSLPRYHVHPPTPSSSVHLRSRPVQGRADLLLPCGASRRRGSKSLLLGLYGALLLSCFQRHSFQRFPIWPNHARMCQPTLRLLGANDHYVPSFRYRFHRVLI